MRLRTNTTAHDHIAIARDRGPGDATNQAYNAYPQYASIATARTQSVGIWPISGKPEMLPIPTQEAHTSARTQAAMTNSTQRWSRRADLACAGGVCMASIVAPFVGRLRQFGFVSLRLGSGSPPASRTADTHAAGGITVKRRPGRRTRRRRMARGAASPHRSSPARSEEHTSE